MKFLSSNAKSRTKQSSFGKASENDDIVVFLDEKEAKKEQEETLRSEKELSKAFDLVMNHGYSSRGASDFMRDTRNFEISHTLLTGEIIMIVPLR